MFTSKARYKEHKELSYPEEKAKAQLIVEVLRCCGRAEELNTNIYHEAEQVLEAEKGIPTKLSGKEKLMFSIWKINKSIYRLIYKNNLINI